ncbi:unnamed protein product [Ambrosiozyma monospora]|uniref:Unnamed protein product n=1 Tax=Ambrosiozyma monospora TaxID=43982 RepID=A0ACB5TAY6_AMBMO|nr:unnamed protein product [Ambrosiozyma monospora]
MTKIYFDPAYLQAASYPPKLGFPDNNDALVDISLKQFMIMVYQFIEEFSFFTKQSDDYHLFVLHPQSCESFSHPSNYALLSTFNRHNYRKLLEENKYFSPLLNYLESRSSVDVCHFVLIPIWYGGVETTFILCDLNHKVVIDLNQFNKSISLESYGSFDKTQSIEQLRRVTLTEIGTTRVLNYLSMVVNGDLVGTTKIPSSYCKFEYETRLSEIFERQKYLSNELLLFGSIAILDVYLPALSKNSFDYGSDNLIVDGMVREFMHHLNVFIREIKDRVTKNYKELQSGCLEVPQSSNIFPLDDSTGFKNPYVSDSKAASLEDSDREIALQMTRFVLCYPSAGTKGSPLEAAFVEPDDDPFGSPGIIFRKVKHSKNPTIKLFSPEFRKLQRQFWNRQGDDFLNYRGQRQSQWFKIGKDFKL